MISLFLCDKGSTAHFTQALCKPVTADSSARGWEGLEVAKTSLPALGPDPCSQGTGELILSWTGPSHGGEEGSPLHP